MSNWKPLAERFNDLPLILAGPIVRRVERSQVSVWIACKYEVKDIVLNISLGAKVIGSSTKQSTIRLGANLHVALLTYKNTGKLLNAGQKYYYDILFGLIESSVPEKNKVLKDEKILAVKGGIQKIAYNGEKLPSFITPVDEIKDLRILQASCRKPHGKGLDAMRAMDYILEATIEKGRNKDNKYRPQQLFLTGDQIYADDVSDILLFMIRDAIKPVLGWQNKKADNSEYKWNDYQYSNEDIQAVIGTAMKDENELKDLNFSPGNRQEICKRIGYTSSAASSHLFFLSEYYLMYMFAFSQELWPVKRDTFPTVESLNLNDDKKDEFNSIKGKIQNYYDTISKVRKALANISTYMIFDDHEVTDDWFLNYDWTEKNLQTNSHINLISRRFICNGLLAYTIFQGWGNRIDLIDSNLKSLIEQIAKNPREFNRWKKLEDLILPKWKKTSRKTAKLIGGLKWSYQIKFEKYQVICIDTRTKRSFLKGIFDGGFPSLISNSDILKQIPTNSSKELTVLVSPSPIFGNRTVDNLQKLISRHGNLGKEYADAEAWFLNPEAFKLLLKQLKLLKKVVILSGDVHYAFSNLIKHSGASYAQLCSSPSLNTALKGEVARIAHTSKLTQRIIKNVFEALDPIATMQKVEDMLNEYKKFIKQIKEYPLVDNREFKVRYGYENFEKLPFKLKTKRGKLPAIASASMEAIKLGEHIVVGKNNVGYVNFENWNTTDNNNIKYEVQHWIWFSFLEFNHEEIYPITIHKANLK